MKIDVDKMSLKELNSFLAAAQRRKKLLSNRRPIGAVRRDVIALAASHGYAIEELFDAGMALRADKPARKRKLPPVAAKYRDPENKRNTWSGRGRMPRWLAERMKRGQSVADFLIPGLGRPTAKKGGSIGKRSVFRQD
ncbi:H-NS histone family protein [Luteimonas yindakuii]|uniref:H-NS histone family protein n=1 Tax=Luteimonas yindakuii TaxID=2565782 RepID=UPI0010A32C58|nr:H-NS histone family protein [Luteimonas yindakuii]QCO66995.1 H-NS histone family protein [Luteimonas yindakuii]